MIFIWNFCGFRPFMLPSHRINGRNNSGKISVFHRGNGVKKKKNC